jgi:hypothetical protein
VKQLYEMVPLSDTSQRIKIFLCLPVNTVDIVKDRADINNMRFMFNGPTSALVCNKTLIQMSHIKTLKITPTCFDHQLIIIRELFDPG